MSVLLFAFKDYYPRGGWRDFTGEFEDVDAAKAVIDALAAADPGRRADVVPFMGADPKFDSAQIVQDNTVVLEWHDGVWRW